MAPNTHLELSLWIVALAALVFVVALVALVVDRRVLQRRRHRAEAALALQQTELADARHEIAALREVLGHEAWRVPTSHEATQAAGATQALQGTDATVTAATVAVDVLGPGPAAVLDAPGRHVARL